MSMRTFDEIQADVQHATDINDADALMILATELDALQTPQAEALASRSRGWALLLRGDYPEALSHLHRALEVDMELGNRRDVASRSQPRLGPGNRPSFILPTDDRTGYAFCHHGPARRIRAA